MDEAIIRTEGLTKLFGKHQAVADLSVDVQWAEVFGYLGPNGAGKTTTIRMLLDFIRPTRGRASLFGLDVRQGSREIRMRTGYLPGELALYGNLTGMEVLLYPSSLRGGVDWALVNELASLLDCDLTQQVCALSWE